MPQKLVRVSLTFLAALALAACGSSSSPTTDGGSPAADGGSVADGGGGQDGGTTADAGCTEATCSIADVTGTYTVCATCPSPIGEVGPLALDITRTCGCEFRGCIQDSDGGQQCGDGRVLAPADGGAHPRINATFPINYQGITVNATCTGTYQDGGVPDLVCQGQGLPITCNGKIKHGSRSTCP
jgi:hypothetical protein